MENMEEKACLCALNKIFGFSPKTGTALVSHIGNAAEIFRRGRKDLEALLGPYSKHIRQLTPQAADDAAEELLQLERENIRFTGFTEEGYPPLLHECDDAPIGLYIRSTTPASELWSQRRAIAVVGSRDISPYGKEWCGRIVSEIACSQAQPMIVSGLALGTDICAHIAALESGLPTIAVMATGPESVYPHRHRAIAERMSATPGCALITDYPPGTAPLAVHFLRRNRIIAGMSDSTILIESKVKGGGMMTCRLAFSYDRDVYALPGRIDDIRSQGCNYLIRAKMAEPIASLPEMMESLGLKGTGRPTGTNMEQTMQMIYGNRMSEEEFSRLMLVFSTIRKTRGITLDELASESGLGYGKVLSIIGLLESDEIISMDLLQRCCINTKKFQ